MKQKPQLLYMTSLTKRVQKSVTESCRQFFSDYFYSFIVHLKELLKRGKLKSVQQIVFVDRHL